VDFCRRVADAGLKIRYEPGAVACHAGGHSARGAPWELRRMAWYSNLLRYAFKHFSAAGIRTVCAAVVAGAGMRALPEAVLQRSVRRLQVYARIVGQAGAGLLTAKSLKV
jgi:GT2 family glycosyltransferase